MKALVSIALIFVFTETSKAFDSFEHLWMGDSTKLYFFGEDQQHYGADYPYKREMQLVYFLLKQNEMVIPKPKPQFIILDEKNTKFSYGEIIAAAGDFIAHPRGNMISKRCKKQPLDECLHDVKRNYLNTFRYMTNHVDNPFFKSGQIELLRSIFKDELNFLASKIGTGRGIHKTIARSYGPFAKFYNNAFGKFKKWYAYKKILNANVDHFAQDAEQTYIAGHELALEKAVKANRLFKLKMIDRANKKLNEAYALEGFAHHFLTDLFSAGHVRTPRREVLELSQIISFNASAIAGGMHDEDGYLGLSVKNDNNNKWKLYGDSSYFDANSKVNRSYIEKALDASIKEIWKTANTGEMPNEYEALGFIPSINPTAKNHNPLVKKYTDKDLQIRSEYHRPNSTKYTEFGAFTGLKAFFKEDIFTFDHSNYFYFLESEAGADHQRYEISVNCYTDYTRSALVNQGNFKPVPRKYFAHYIPKGKFFDHAVGVNADISYYVVSPRDGKEIIKSCLILAEDDIEEIRGKFYKVEPEDIPIAVYNARGHLFRILGKGHNYYKAHMSEFKMKIDEYAIELGGEK